MNLALSPSELKSGLARLLSEARARTMLLIEPLSDDDLVAQHDPLMSPILWDLGHIAHFEELWLTRNLDGPIEFSEMPGMYNPFENPRATRASLPLMPMEQVKRSFAEIRERVLEKLESVELREDNPLLREGFVYRMVLQHEYQHNETILQTLQLKRGEPYRAPRAVEFARAIAPAEDMVRFAGGEVTIGSVGDPSAYDNEKPRYTRTIAAFRIDRFPVTNRRYLEFVADGGYTTREWWSAEGWDFINTNRIEAPKHWERAGAGWIVRSMDRVTELDPARPVCHVCFHEADAFANWAGVRLPTEFEWEAAASWNPDTRESAMYPWGDRTPDATVANVDQLAFSAAPIGAYFAASPVGCQGMIGDVWEWTSSDFSGYPGFQAFPYPEYSEVFFGSEYKVLRGGSWATRPGAIRNTFRNWDYPIRRQIFSGFRCAADD